MGFHSFPCPRDPSEEPVACIQRILEQDDPETPLSSLHSLIAYYTKASELAAILKEDSPSLSFNPTSPALYEYTPQQYPSHAKPPQFASIGMRSPEPLASRRVASNSGESSEQSLDGTSSKLLDVGLFRTLLSTLSTACKQEKSEITDVDKHSHGGVKHQKTLGILKPRNNLSFGKPRVCKYGSMSISKPRSYDEYVDMSIHMAGLPSYIDLHDMLLQCSRAVAVNNTDSAMAIACKMKQQTSPHGSAAERLSYYFVKALYARFEGTGWLLYAGHFGQRSPSSRQILQASLKYMSSCPFAKAAHFFANQEILRVAKGASTLHIIEHQVTGIQYASLFKELAALPGGPPKVRLVGLVVPHYSILPAQREVIGTAFVEEMGPKLSKCAESFKVPFQFIPWVGTREKIRLQDFVSSKRSPDEVLVLISACFLRFVMDDILDPSPMSLRSFKMIYDVNPDLYIQGVVSGTYSSPFYSTRFKEALFHFTCIYDMLDTFINKDDQARLVLESEVLGKAILNIVACEGLPVSERVVKYRQWQAAIEEIGMQQLPIHKDMLYKIQRLLQSWHKEYIVAEDRQYLIMGWKGRTLYALSAWKSPTRLC